ncbi:LysM peptidoglycan-binding domain-containing protein [Tessaracoccus sp. HDW20]|uniref:LysM peptidoglycan-binding domain-containing protein n=1 Tax=Tessaracoccus coleopterorum TaxID=2714950 RepID=UPI001E31E51F|nr:LysM peptidoglycan-binding domain-containing protein [Tessaracoccus coleopterorum]NHB84717.1 LysM peptidoglycan-binding domain-containing protein [Tessaracoccus coleopterorum]
MDDALVVVQRGDSLWAIAERVLGDGARWPEIHELNRGMIADPDEIEIGWVLALPDAQPPAPADPPPSHHPRPGLPTPPLGDPDRRCDGHRVASPASADYEPTPPGTATPEPTTPRA